jgi:hypothetical protein
MGPGWDQHGIDLRGARRVVGAATFGDLARKRGFTHQGHPVYDAAGPENKAPALVWLTRRARRRNMGGSAMKNVRVRAIDGNGPEEAAAPPRHLTLRELHVALVRFAVEAGPMVQRGQWLAQEARLALARSARRQTRLRRAATLLHAQADDLEARARRRPPRRTSSRP